MNQENFSLENSEGFIGCVKREAEEVAEAEEEN